MSSLADRTIVALRDQHDAMRALVANSTDDELGAQSGAAEWDVAQVLSHLGSGAEITLAGLRANLAGSPPPDSDLNQAVWDRWNALDRRAQADEFLDADEQLVAAYEALEPATRQSYSQEFGFLPAPLPLAAVLGMRLNEALEHGWDVAVGLDADAEVTAGAAELLLEHLAGDNGFQLRFTAKADAVPGRAAITLAETGFGLMIDNAVEVTAKLTDPTGAFHGPAGSAVRLLAGRLKPDRTPDGVTVTGDVTLDDLRRVFPGY